MRTRMLAAVSLILAACEGSGSPPTLSISPSGAQTVSGPVTITASPASLANDVTWSLSGGGTLSGTKGLSVVYRPPVPANPSQPSTVTATAGSQTASVTFTSQAPPPLASRTIPGLTGNVDVTYDQYDIPHIFCANQNDCFAVQGYIQAQDRLFQMDLFRRTAEGRVSELVGGVGVSQDQQFRVFFMTRDGQKLEEALATDLDNDPTTKAKLQAYVNGINAYITSLAQPSASLPGEYAQLPAAPFTAGDIPPWTIQDTLAIARLQQFSLSESIEEELGYGLFAQLYGNPASPLLDMGKMNAYALRAKQPVQAYPLAPTDPTFFPTRPTGSGSEAMSAPRMDATPWMEGMATLRARMDELRPLFGTIHTGAGSNNWVVDAAHSTAGKAIVSNDPHLSLQYPPLGHLSAMTASDGSGLDVMGWTFPGTPGVQIGRGAHVGWGATVVGYDVTDLYQETLTACTGTGTARQCGAVLFGTNPAVAVPLTLRSFPITVRGGTDASATVLIVPHHGPILHYDPQHDSAISMRWTGHEITQDVRAFLDLLTATSVGDVTAPAGTAFGALQRYATGAQNFVLADDAGNIGYDPHALVPKRPWAMTAATLLPWLPLPGDGSAEWGSGVVADNCAGTVAGGNPPAAACWVPDNLLPHACGAAACAVKPDKGYIATANSDPAGYTDDNIPLGTGVVSGLYSGYLSFDWSDPTAIRYARIADRLKAKTGSGGKVSIDDMTSLQSDHVMLIAKLFHPFLPATITGSQKPVYDAAKAVWDQWDTDGYDCPTGLSGTDPKSAPDTNATHVRDSAGCLLFHTFLKTLLHDVFDDDFAAVSRATGQAFGANRGAEVRGILYMLDPATPAGDTHLCNDIRPDGTPGATHSCGEQVVTALVTAGATLTNAYGASTNWLWGRVHTLTTQSPGAPLIAAPFSAGPYARPGGAETVDVGDPDSSQSSPLAFAYSHGSNVRFVAVMDSPSGANAQAKMQLPGPERDAPAVLSNSLSLLEMYVQNLYFDFLYGHQVDNKGLPTQRFTAP